MGTFISLLFMLFLMVGGGYYTLRFFSRLAGVDMPAAFSWGFKAKRFELVLTFILFYIMAFIMVMVMVLRPITLLEVKTSHVGGLLGYQESENQAMVYDPPQQSYVGYEMYPPLPTPTRFNETFRVVSFYKPFFRSHYQNTEHMGLAVTLILIFIGALGAVLAYVALHGLARAYINKNRISGTVTHQTLALQFRKLFKIGFRRALFIVLAALAILSIVSSQTVRGVMRGYNDRFLSDQQGLRNRLESLLSPGDIVQGRLIRRFYRLDKVYHKRMGSQYQQRERVEYYRYADFIVEFPDLIRVPVYLTLPLLAEGEPGEALKTLDTLFPDEKAAVPSQNKEFDFIVNDDFSISLVEAQ